MNHPSIIFMVYIQNSLHINWMQLSLPNYKYVISNIHLDITENLFVCVLPSHPINNMAHRKTYKPFCGIATFTPNINDVSNLTITMHPQFTLNVTFLYFNIPNTGGNCSYCYISVHYRNISHTFCGRREPWSVYGHPVAKGNITIPFKPTFKHTL